MHRGRSPFIVFSFSILLYILGFFVLLLYGAQDISRGLSGGQTFIIEFTSELDEGGFQTIQDLLISSLNIGENQINYISPADALDIYQTTDEVRETIVQENPFRPIAILSISNRHDLNELDRIIGSNPLITDIIADISSNRSFIDQIGSFRSMLLWLVMILLALVSFINYQFIHILLKDKQSMIKLMKLSGAFEGHIIKPFTVMALKDAVLSSFIAVVLIGLTILSLTEFREIFQYINTIPIALSLLTIVIVAIVIYTFSTYMIVKLYLKNN